MIQAELRGKLSLRSDSPAERSEDALTSAVFGGLRYLEPETGMLPWLRRAEPLVADAPPVFGNGVTGVRTVFWPQFGDRECDILLVLERGAVEDLVAIECKFLSGKSEAAGNEQLGEHPVLFNDKDQLAYYFAALKRDDVRPRLYTPSRVGRRAVLFVTAHYQMPRTEIEDSLRACRDRTDAGRCFYWLSWYALSAALEASARRETDRFRLVVIEDLRALLSRRGLQPFIGFSHLRPFTPVQATFRERWTMPSPRVPRLSLSDAGRSLPDWSWFKFD